MEGHERDDVAPDAVPPEAEPETAEPDATSEPEAEPAEPDEMPEAEVEPEAESAETDETPEPETAEPDETPGPDETPEPETAEPDETPGPDETSEPEAEPEVEPAEPDEMPEPDATPEPETAEPDETPGPDETPEPEAEPAEPDEMPEPEVEPEAETAEPDEMPEPEVEPEAESAEADETSEPEAESAEPDETPEAESAEPDEAPEPETAEPDEAPEPEAETTEPDETPEPEAESAEPDETPEAETAAPDEPRAATEWTPQPPAPLPGDAVATVIDGPPEPGAGDPDGPRVAPNDWPTVVLPPLDAAPAPEPTPEPEPTAKAAVGSEPPGPVPLRTSIRQTAPPATRTDPPTQVFPKASPDAPSHRWRRVLALTAAGVVVLGGLYVGGLWLWADRVPPGTTVAGVPIGALDAEAAVATLEEALAAPTTDPFALTVGTSQTTLDPVAAGLRLDAQATVDSVTGFGLEPARLWRQLFGAGAAEPVSTVDDDALAAALSDAAEDLATAPIDGRLEYVDGEPVASAPEDGVAVDEPAARALLMASWLTVPRPIELPTVVDPPAIGQDELDRAMAELALPLASAPVAVEVADQVAELPVDILTSVATFVPEGEQLALQLDGAVLVDAVIARTTDLLTPPADARFVFENDTPTIVAGEPGTTIDPDDLAEAVASAGTSSSRRAAVELVATDPAESTAALEALGITQVISEFSTPLTSEPRRTSNIANGAAKITGVLIRPGELFSLAEALGPIDAAHGYVQAGAIVSGQHTDAWGGGLSQMSTTTYNAAYFAGFELVEHHPHSEWFSRYPEGREATIFTPTLDMKWRNNTPYGALVQSWVAGGRVYVRIWGTPYWTVESATSGRSNVVAPTTVYSQSPTCTAQSPGNSGFTVTVTRRVLLDGVEHDNESWTVRYRPQNRVVCGPQP